MIASNFKWHARLHGMAIPRTKNIFHLENIFRRAAVLTHVGANNTSFDCATFID
jgi:hypothetical protein